MNGVDRIRVLVIDFLEKQTTGVKLKEIASFLLREGVDLSIRQLQRQIRNELKLGNIRAKGAGKTINYYTILPLQEPFDSLWLKDVVLDYGGKSIKLSQAGAKLLEKVSRPFHHKVPVEYQASLLLKYEPNVDAYLTKTDLKELNRWCAAGLKLPPGTYEREVLNRLLIDLSWNSSRLEGNTYGLLDTQRLIAKGELTDQKSVLEAQMILNHKEAIEFLIQGLNSYDDDQLLDYTPLIFKNLHAILAQNLMPDLKAIGRLRQMPVGISGTKYQPLAIPQLIEEYFQLLLDKASKIINPFEQAFFLMVHIPYLEPFDDVNKRVSRLAVNIPLLKHKLSPLSFIDVPTVLYVKGILAVYEHQDVQLIKEIFIWAYRRSASQYALVRQTVQNPDPFKLKYREQIKHLINLIIKTSLGMVSAQKLLRQTAEELKLNAQDKEEFVLAIESELLALNEGNFARYQVSLTEFLLWQKAWEG